MAKAPAKKKTAKSRGPRREVRDDPCQVCGGEVITVDDPAYKNPKDAPAFTYCTQCATVFKCADSKVPKYNAQDYK